MFKFPQRHSYFIGAFLKFLLQGSHPSMSRYLVLKSDKTLKYLPTYTSIYNADQENIDVDIRIFQIAQDIIRLQDSVKFGL